jgi:hypothetical protein
VKARESTVITEARRIGCYHATLRKALRAMVGEEEYNRLVWSHRSGGAPSKNRLNQSKKAPFIVDTRPMKGSTLCKRCRGETLAGTNGDGLAVLVCLRCGGREVVFPRRAIPAS